MLSILDKAKSLTAAVLEEGDIAVDATLGNGHDAAHLAQQVAPNGKLFGIDLREDAIRSTRKRLESRGTADVARLIRGDHASLLELLPDEVIGRVGGIMFNLGYLPGSDHTTPTRADSTLAALEQALELLRTGGRITVVTYRGHAAGQTEYHAVMNTAKAWNQREFEVLHYRFVNQINEPPELLVVEKLR